MQPKPAISYADFEKLDVRVGVILEVDDFPRAKKPSYRITIDFGDPIGIRRSSAQLTNYAKAELIGKQIIAVVNFEPKNIAGFLSECLILGVPTEEGVVSFLSPTIPAKLGGGMF
ncbi:MAG: tRNA-binding protein [bacterium]|nr:tRNA-binding protein [bacterium]